MLATVIALGAILIILVFILIYGVYYAIEKLESIKVNVQILNDISNSIDLLNSRVDSYLGGDR